MIRPYSSRWRVHIRVSEKRTVWVRVSATSEASARFRALDKARALGYTAVVLSDIISAEVTP